MALNENTVNRDHVTSFQIDYIFILFLETQYNITVKVIETDNEIVTVKPKVERWLASKGIIVEPSAPDTQAQNDSTERSGGVNKERSRAMRLDSTLPWDMWPEITRAAVYLYNRTPRYINNWKSPHQIFFTHVAFQNGAVHTPASTDFSVPSNPLALY
jgi:hypothetical protein